MYLYVRHILSCRIGGLVSARHDKVRDEILYLNQQDFPSNCICKKNFINQGRSRLEEEVSQGLEVLETRGDVLIRGLWEIQTEAIIDVRFGYADAGTYKHKPMYKLLDC